MVRGEVNVNGRHAPPEPPAGVGAREGASTLAAIFRRRALLIVATAILAAVVAGTISRSQEPRYESTAQLLFRPLGPEFQILGLGFSPSDEDQELQAGADVALVSSLDVAGRVARRSPTRRDAAGVADDVSVRRQAGSRIVTVTAADSNPHAAARLANDYVEVVKEVRRETDNRRARSARRLLGRELATLSRRERRQSEKGAALRDQIQKLRMLEQLGSGSPQVLERARPADEPTAPRTRRNIALGALFGLLLGAAIAGVREQSDRRLRDRDELAAAFALPVLAEIPRCRSLARRQKFAELPSAVDEAFGLLQAKLRYAPDREAQRVVVVISASTNEGTSTVAWHLARAAARAGTRPLLIEANLRRPSFAQRGRLDEAPGLADVLQGSVTVEEAVQPVALGAAADRRDGDSPARRLDVLVAGTPAMHPSDLLQSARLPRMFADAVNGYDLVVVDAPALQAVADAIPLVRVADGVVVVARMSGATDEQAAQLRDQLDSLQAHILGVVANGVSPAQPRTTYVSRPARA